LAWAFSLVACLGVAWPVAGAEKPQVVALWPGKAPDETGKIGAEKVLLSPKLSRKEVEVTEQTRMVTNVTKPTITIYRPAKADDTGTAMLICPGGGYWNLFWQLEGEEVAAWLNKLGVTGIILKYRVPRRPDEPKGEPARRPLQDAQRAVSLVRSNARKWGIDPKRIGMVGFSAGGHLAIATATRFEKRAYKPIDDIDKISCRPDFAILVYPGYLKARDKDELAPGLRIAARTPPIFLAHGGADIISPPEHSVVLYRALKRARISAELHIYEGAAHDFGVRPSGRPCSTWTQSCADWLRDQGFLAPKVHRDVPYAEPKNKRQTLDVYAPTRGKNHPVVVWIHGGGWQAGDKSDVHQKPQAFADKGFVFVSINYRLLPKVTIAQMAFDVAKAIRWAHDHARDYGGDPATMFVMGHSAGAQLAALVCTDGRYLKAEKLSLSIVKGCVPVDGDTYDVPMQIRTVEKKRAEAYKKKFGDAASQKDLSPVTHVAKGKKIPPFLILHVADHPETKGQSQRLAKALQAAGVSAKAYPAKGKTHGTINADLGGPDDKPTKELFEFLARALKKR
jgi:acetyl esterase/lipase